MVFLKATNGQRYYWGVNMFIVVYLAAVVICWKSYDFFYMTLLDAATTTGFMYYLKKIGFTFFVPLFIAQFFI